jgi:LPXTG-motif cell wall-anchored protein
LPGAKNDDPGTDDNGTPGDTTDDVTPALVVTATVFPTSGQPTGAVVSPDGQTLTLAAEGSWEVRADGGVIFTPAAGFSGTSSSVVYRVEDVNGAADTATLTVVVQPGPQAAKDTATTGQGVAVSLKPLGNDTPGRNADGSGGSWATGAVRLQTAAALPVGSTVSTHGKTLTVPGQGVWKVGADETVVFDPDPTFVGTTTPAAYVATDAIGNQAAASMTVTVTPSPARPHDGGATASTGETTSGDPVTVDVLANVTPATGAHLLPGSTCLLTDTVVVDGAPHAVDGGGDCAATLTVDGVGTWTVEPDGTIRFAPADGFTGKASIRFQVRDTAGNTYTAALAIKVKAPASVLPDTGGPALVVLLGGLLLVLVGSVLLLGRRRRPVLRRH